MNQAILVYVNNGATQRLSRIAAALFLLSFILFLSSWVDRFRLLRWLA